MRYFSLPFSLRDRAGDGEGTGVADARDTFVHDLKDDSKPDPKPADKSPAEKELEAARKENETLKRQNQELTSSERYWAERARGSKAEEEPETDDEPLPSRRPEEPDVTAEQFLDILSKEGLKGLKRLGFMTQAEVDDKLEEVRRDTRQEVEQSTRNSAWGTQFAAEFPEIAADNVRVAKGEKPQSELYKRTAQVLQEMVADDKTLARSPAALSTAARMAKRLIEAEGKNVDREDTEDNGRRDRREGRRDRIDSQRTERGSARGAELEDEAPQMTETQRQVLKGLSAYGATEAAYTGKGKGKR